MIHIDATRLPRIMQCLGSVDMPCPVPNYDDDPTARDEGNAAHYMAQQVFEGKAINDLIGQRAYNGVVMDSAMGQHVTTYLQALDCGQMEVVTNWGTVAGRADHISWRPEISTLTIDDFKYGYRLVEPDENWTLISHAIGWCILNGVQPERIILRIHQPRRAHPLGPTREWSVTYPQLEDYYARITDRLASNDRTLQTGPLCAKCPSASICPAYRESTYNAIDATTHQFTDALSEQQLSDEMTLLTHATDALSGRKKALEELMRHKIESGAIIPKYMVDIQHANRRFKSAFTPEVIKLMTGVDATESKACTPAELERRGASPEIIQLITERPVTARKLVRTSADAKARKLLKKG